MLNKSICRKCNEADRGWKGSDERWWDDFAVYCPEEPDEYGMSKKKGTYIDIRQEPPKTCRFKLEQLVLNNG